MNCQRSTSRYFKNRSLVLNEMYDYRLVHTKSAPSLTRWGRGGVRYKIDGVINNKDNQKRLPVFRVNRKTFSCRSSRTPKVLRFWCSLRLSAELGHKLSPITSSSPLSSINPITSFIYREGNTKSKSSPYYTNLHT